MRATYILVNLLYHIKHYLYMLWRKVFEEILRNAPCEGVKPPYFGKLRRGGCLERINIAPVTRDFQPNVRAYNIIV